MEFVLKSQSISLSLLAALALTATPACARVTGDKNTVEQTAGNSSAFEQASRLLSRFQSENEVPIAGISLTVLRDGEMIFSQARGVTDLESSAAATTQTRYRVYSIAKAMTATAAMRLVELGRLDLDHPIGTYMPELPEHVHGITARQLMGHRSGIRHYRDGEWVSVSHRECQSPADALAVFINDPLDNEPGTAMAYSTFGYVVLSAVIEAAYGEPYEQAMQDLVFGPAGMSATAIEGREVNGFDTATFYVAPDPNDPDDDWLATEDWNPSINASCKFGGGGFLSTSEDLARFGWALSSGQLVSTDSVAFLTDVYNDGLNQGPAYGHGFFDGRNWMAGVSDWAERESARESIPDLPETPIWFHGGTAAGGHALLFVYPEYNLVATFAATNRLGGNVVMLDLHEIALLFAPDD